MKTISDYPGVRISVFLLFLVVVCIPSSILAQTLHEAAAAGELQTIERLLAGGADIHAQDKDGRTPLHVAVRQGQRETAKLLAARGANPNVIYKQGMPLLIGATYAGSKSAVQLLLEIGADIHAIDEKKNTSLHYAITQGHPEVAEFLLSQGAKIDAPGEEGRTPLNLAVKSGKKDMVEYLLTKGANVNAPNELGFVSLHGAAAYGHLEIAQLLVQKNAAVNVAAQNGYIPLHSAAATGHSEMIKFLLENGGLIEAKDSLGRTPLFHASLMGHEKSVQLLLERGAFVNARGKWGHSPLHGAASNGHEKVVEILLAQGAEINAESENGYTPLASAAANKHGKVIDLLIENGADVNARFPFETEISTYRGDTLLHRAATSGDLEMAKYLLSKGANVNIMNNCGRTPLLTAVVSEFAPEAKRLAVIKLLVENGALVNVTDDVWVSPLRYAETAFRLPQIAAYLRQQGAWEDMPPESLRHPLLLAVHKNKSEKVKQLLAQGENPDVTDENLWTALHWAARSSQLNMIQILLDSGADINARTIHMTTPLYEAIYGGFGGRKAAKYLIEKGADVNAGKRNGKTPLHEAADNGNFDIVSMLIEKGAKVNAVNDYGETPMHQVRYDDAGRIVQLLLESGANPNIKNRKGKTPLAYALDSQQEKMVEVLIKQGTDEDIHLAARYNRKDLVEKLLDKLVDVNKQTKSGITALHEAAYAGRKEIAALLLQRGANKTIKTKGQELTALDYAKQQGHKETIVLLESNIPQVSAKAASTSNKKLTWAQIRQWKRKQLLEARGGYMWSIQYAWYRQTKNPMLKAVLQGQIDSVEKLLKNGNNINILAAIPTKKKGVTPLHCAVYFDDEAMSAYLLDHGADLNLPDLDQQDTPLHYAAERGWKEIIELLVQKGANLEARNKNGYTPLFLAVQSGEKTAVEILLEKKANLHYVDDKGNTLLHEAVLRKDFGTNDYTGIVRLLLSKGLDVNAINKMEETPLHKAASNMSDDNVEMVRLLAEQGADIQWVSKDIYFGGSALHIAAFRGHKEIVKFLVANGVDVNSRDLRGRTALHRFYEDKWDMADLLIQLGADINAVDLEGNYPIHVMAEKGFEETVVLLIQKGANPNIRDKEGKTPLHLAVSEGHVQVVKQLLAHNADCNATDKGGHTPLGRAEQNRGRDLIIQMLREQGGVSK